MLYVNGKEVDHRAGETIEVLLKRLGYNCSRVAVEKNLKIVPKAKYSAVTIEDNDRLEIVRFVGGGC